MATPRKQPSAAAQRAQEIGAYTPTDRLEKARAAAKPFSVQMSDGVIFHFNDPMRLPYLQLVRLQDGSSLDDAMLALLGPDQFEDLTRHPDVDGYWMQDVFSEFKAHFGLPGASGEALASSA